ncbi:MAG: hypothetical protein R3B46_01030 [Phycisphaerales bacterium]
MSEGARIRSVEALRPLRAAILVFARDVASILSSAEAEIAKTIDWLQRDRVTYWRAETQRRGEMLARAKSDLYRAQIQKKSLVDEKKAIGRAKEALRDAEERLEASRKWAVRLEHDRALYAGAVQGLSVSVSIDLPKAAAMLELMSRSLDEYVALSASWADGTLDDSPGTVRPSDVALEGPAAAACLSERRLWRRSGRCCRACSSVRRLRVSSRPMCRWARGG